MGRQRDRNRMSAVMAGARERGMVPNTEPLTDEFLAACWQGVVSPDADIRRLVAEVRRLRKELDLWTLYDRDLDEAHAESDRLRTVLNDLLLTRQAHQDAWEAEVRLADDLEAEYEELLAAHDRTLEAEIAHDAAWDRARVLLAGEEVTDAAR